MTANSKRFLDGILSFFHCLKADINPKNIIFKSSFLFFIIFSKKYYFLQF